MSSPRAQGNESNQASQAFENIPSPAFAGQDHDRMETDEENEGSDSSSSEREVDTPEPESQEIEPEQRLPPPTEDEVMDTSPDNPPVTDAPQPEHPSQASSEGTISESQAEPTNAHPVQVDTASSNTDVTQAPQTTTAGAQAHNTSVEARVRAAERGLAEMADTRGELRRIERVRAQRIRREAVGEDAAGDEDSGDSSDEEEHLYWVNLKEDTSAPDERELKVIEENGDEFSALDHEHWEKLIYEPLDDPEYVPDGVERITWTVKGVHGTAEKPNKEKIMRSPSVLIGGYYWNIKYYPHGNDGTDQLSIYIECSPTPREEELVSSEKAAAPETIIGTSEDQTTVESSNPNTTNDTVIAEPDNTSNSVDVRRLSPEREDVMEDTITSPERSEKNAGKSWGIAAQIGCVLYNPEEPRVNVHQKGCHRFYNDSEDWGWTRFHGPWNEIHKRQRFQRQALLRNDTLAFTAYIRTIRDDTKALWWHPPKDSPEWDCEAMTGVPAFECQTYQSSAMIAAVASWMHLTPIKNLIRKTQIPDPVWEANKRMRPAFEELQDLYDEAESSIPLEDHGVSLRGLVSILNFYSANIDSKMDVVKIWETLRRVLNFEASGLDSVENGNGSDRDMFNDILLLKQPDLLNHANPNTIFPLSSQKRASLTHGSEPQSVQETLDKAAFDETTMFRKWQSFEGQIQETRQQPAVLQVELHRQSFAREARKWRKLTHHIKIDETIELNECHYTLYGMIVHSGDLESSEYYSVIRPEGPGTRWVKYAGDSHDRKVTILTSKQAIEAHEGASNDVEGTAAVAYIVLYVRTGDLSEILCTPFKRKAKEESNVHEAKATTAVLDEDVMDSNNDEPDMPVFIYDAEGFDGYEGRGICDPWKFQNEGRFVEELSFPSSTAIGKVKEHVNSGLFKTEKPETTEIRLWPMNTFITDVGVRAFPSLLSFKTYCEETLDEMGQHSGGCRFWMKKADKAAVQIPEVPAPASTSGADHVTAQEARDAAIQAVLSTIQAADEQVNEAIQAIQSQTGGPVEITDTEMAGAENTSEDIEHPRQRRQQQLLLQMQQAQQQQQQLAAAQQAQQRQQEADRNAQQIKDTYFLVKVFDADSQTLRGTGSAIVKNESKIVEETKKLLQVESTEAWDFYNERGIDIDLRDCVKAHETFESRFGGADGGIIIAQRRLNAAR